MTKLPAIQGQAQGLVLTTEEIRQPLSSRKRIISQISCAERATFTAGTAVNSLSLLPSLTFEVQQQPMLEGDGLQSYARSMHHRYVPYGARKTYTL